MSWHLLEHPRWMTGSKISIRRQYETESLTEQVGLAWKSAYARYGEVYRSICSSDIYLLDASELDAKTEQGDGGERDTTNGRKGSNWWESHTG